MPNSNHKNPSNQSLQSSPQRLNIALLFVLAVSVLLMAAVLFGFLRDDTVKINNNKITVTVADSSEERERGLGGRKRLANNEGMLFKFNSSDLFCIWMKDMKFPIDIIWLDENKKVVTIKENATPESYPDSFCPTKPAKYVLEVNAGTVLEKNITNETVAEF